VLPPAVLRGARVLSPQLRVRGGQRPACAAGNASRPFKLWQLDAAPHAVAQHGLLLALFGTSLVKSEQVCDDFRISVFQPGGLWARCPRYFGSGFAGLGNTTAGVRPWNHLAPGAPPSRAAGHDRRPPHYSRIGRVAFGNTKSRSRTDGAPGLDWLCRQDSGVPPDSILFTPRHCVRLWANQFFRFGMRAPVPGMGGIVLR